jgi:hypothetical protein
MASYELGEMYLSGRRMVSYLHARMNSVYKYDVIA